MEAITPPGLGEAGSANPQGLVGASGLALCQHLPSSECARLQDSEDEELSLMGSQMWQQAVGAR